MDNRNTEATAFELIAGCSLVIAALVVTALIVRLLTTALPLVEQLVVPSVLAQGTLKTLVARSPTPATKAPWLPAAATTDVFR